MANITTQRTGEIQRKILETLRPFTEGLAAKDVLARLSESLVLTDFEKADYPNSPGVRRFEKIARFSTISLVKAGWLVKNGGIWTVTPEGNTAFDRYRNPVDFRKAAVAKYREWAADQEPDEDAVETTDEPKIAGVTLEEAEEKAWEEISRHLAVMPPYDFQDLVAGLLQGMGYHVTFVSPPGPDQGIDIIAHTDPLGIQDPRIKVQVKRRSQDRTSADGIRSFLAILGENDAGIFVSLGGFTSEAEREARAQERRKIMLIDAKRLVGLWVQHYARVPDEQRRLLPLKPIYFLSLDA